MNRFQNLKLNDLKPNPFHQFDQWFEDAKKHISLYPEAMSLATLDKDGYPQTRYVLLRGYKPPIFQFFTNYNSNKGQQLIEYPKASLLFYWKELGRQIRITGTVQKSSEIDSDAYWSTRPHESRIHAMASNQSHEVQNFQDFLNLVKDLENKHHDENIIRPSNWGGFDFKAQKFEFWQEGEFRLHHRFVYSQTEQNKWQIKQLYP